MRALNRQLPLFIVKVASRCNLNCTYCYIYNKGDSSWERRPPLMTHSVYRATLDRICEHCTETAQREVTLSFHGGEPCLLGPDTFENWCNEAANLFRSIDVRVNFSLQTNGTLLDQQWFNVLQRNGVSLGLSIDGPPSVHDRFRVDHKGRGSFAKIEPGLKLLRDSNLPFSIISVIQLGSDPLEIHRFFVSLGCKNISYLMPDFTHDTMVDVRERFGATPCADFLIRLFDEWWFNGTIDVRISNFWEIGKSILGGEPQSDYIGNRPLRYVGVESDGDIESLDVFRICKDGMSNTGLNVLRNSFLDIVDNGSLQARAIFDGFGLPRDCEMCPEKETCAGGHLPHRYAHRNGFDNCSVWCHDLLALYNHIRERLGVSVEETVQRRELLSREQLRLGQ